MQTEIVTTPGELAGMPGIPRHVRDWAFKRGEPDFGRLLSAIALN